MIIDESSAQFRQSVPCFDLCRPLTCSLTSQTPGCHVSPLLSHISPEGGRAALLYPPFELLGLHPAIWHPGYPRSWWWFALPWVLPPVLALGPLCSTLKWNVCPLSSMPSTTLAGGAKRREAGVNVTVELFQLSLEPADDPGMCHETCCWPRPMWV